MKLGCCLNMIARTSDGIGLEFIEKLSEIGFDYAELPLAEMMALSDDDFSKLKERVKKSGIACETCNNFFPKTVRLTGKDVDMETVMQYVEKALSRARELEVERLVFGSGGAKNVPDGFPMEEGYKQVVELLKKINPIAKEKGITIVIEPLRKAECNLINTFEEGCQLAKDVDGDNVKVLVDFYHLTEEKEPVEHLLKYGNEYLQHVHFAYPKGRIYPSDINEADYGPFIRALNEIRYDLRISCEAYTDNFEESAPLAFAFLKNIFNKTRGSTRY
jgi:D-psicose/D-tagatose/L-ribulose 3-epimerase